MPKAIAEGYCQRLYGHLSWQICRIDTVFICKPLSDFCQFRSLESSRVWGSGL